MIQELKDISQAVAAIKITMLHQVYLNNGDSMTVDQLFKHSTQYTY